MKMNLYSLFFPQTLFLSIFLIIIQATSSQNLIRSTCRTSAKNDSNIDYGFCMTSIQAAPASQCATIRSLGFISIRLMYYNVTDTRCHVRHLLKTKRFDPFVRQCLKDCFDLYLDAVSSAIEAMRSYRARQFADLNMQISSIMDAAATTCEDGFGEREGVVSPLSKRNNNTFQISAVALSVMNIIQTGSG